MAQKMVVGRLCSQIIEYSAAGNRGEVRRITGTPAPRACGGRGEGGRFGGKAPWGAGCNKRPRAPRKGVPLRPFTRAKEILSLSTVLALRTTFPALGPRVLRLRPHAPKAGRVFGRTTPHWRACYIRAGWVPAAYAAPHPALRGEPYPVNARIPQLLRRLEVAGV